MIEIVCSAVEVDMTTGVDIVDVTPLLSAALRQAGIVTGSLQATVIGSTASLTTIEYEPGVVQDLKEAIHRLAPPGAVYRHEQAWHDGNGHSHVQAALLGPSLVLPVRNGALTLGTWQQAVAINHDNRPRRRRIEITLIGER